MSDECKILDPTAFGLFFVALVSLPIALACIMGYIDGAATSIEAGGNLGTLLIVAAVFIFIAALAAYRAGSNFGFIVFGLVALGVYYAGAQGGDIYINITLGIIYLVALIWSYRVGNPKTLTLILLTTALIFIFGGIATEAGADIYESVWLLLKGIAALANFVLTLYLAFALADEKLPCY